MLGKRRTIGTVTLVTRAGCHLCEEAEPVVARAAGDAGAAFEVLDVDSDARLAVWSDHVPVVLLDGVKHTQWWVDEKELRKALGVRV